MAWKPFAKRVAYWSIPRGFQEIIRRCLLREGDTAPISPEEESLLNRNSKFLNRHLGQRCFVLATGPSIREQDLRPLQNEWCIGVSEFYKHKHYDLIKPAYYVFSANHCPFTDADALRELEEMKSCAKRETFFFSVTDRNVVTQSNLVDDWERVHYLSFAGNFASPRIDLTRPLPGPQTASLIAIWIALYMGFADVNLLGCDHDNLWQWDGSVHHGRKHFYDGDPTTGYEPFDIDEELRCCLSHRAQYRWTNRVAASQNSKIINANPKSYIDIFPKVALSRLFGA